MMAHAIDIACADDRPTIGARRARAIGTRSGGCGAARAGHSAAGRGLHHACRSQDYKRVGIVTLNNCGDEWRVFQQDMRMAIKAVTTERRWLVERRDGRWMEGRVVPVRHPDYGIVFETQAYFDGTVFYARRYPTRLEAEHDADDRLRDAVE